ncbi:MAG: hypothetical protein HW403_450 [Dehalococcoidia bacterium]|nr:hypothetical protein [Dehalococcoidia bacterium]
MSIIKGHPYLAAWAGTAVAMVAMLLVAAQGVELLPRQLGALVVSTILLAGLCVWIISWESSGEAVESESEKERE